MAESPYKFVYFRHKKRLSPNISYRTNREQRRGGPACYGSARTSPSYTLWIYNESVERTRIPFCYRSLFFVNESLRLLPSRDSSRGFLVVDGKQTNTKVSKCPSPSTVNKANSRRLMELPWREGRRTKISAQLLFEMRIIKSWIIKRHSSGWVQRKPEKASCCFSFPPALSFIALEYG